LLVKFFATFRQITKEKQFDYRGSAGNVKELLEELSTIYGENFRSMVFNGEELSHQVIILVNGIHVAHLKGKDTELQPQDIVNIFPVLAGG
jgi:MoaD family protein